MFGADLDLLVNPKEEDLKFLDNIEKFFDGMARLAYELPLYKLYKNNLYHFLVDSINVRFIFCVIFSIWPINSYIIIYITVTCCNLANSATEN